jgi:rhamnosyl/mannosyltransferase
MKILHVYKTFINDTMGGTEQVLAQFVATPHLTEFDYTVLSLTRQSAQQAPRYIEGFRGIKNIRYPEQLSIASNSMSWQMLCDFSRVVQDFDLIHYHFPWPFADLLHLL